jgi:hypothetical protein
MRGFPPVLAAEITWGIEQSQFAAGNSGDDLVAMIGGLIKDAKYRKEADAAIDAIQAKQQEQHPKDYEEAGKEEVRFAKAMWDENFASAYQTARSIADQLTSAELAGYRAWWWYLAAFAASLMDDVNAVSDCLGRASKCGVNSGWLNRTRLLRTKNKVMEVVAPEHEPNAEGLWEVLSDWGWAGPSFEERLTKMVDQLKKPDHLSYHEGLETLGKAFGASTTRTTEQGSPDVVWSFASDLHVAFEAKTEKKPVALLSKKDVQEAKGHSDWVRSRLSENVTGGEVGIVVVAPSPSLHQIALPFAGGLYYVAPDRVLATAGEVADSIRQLRVKFSGREFAEALPEFSAAIRNLNLTVERVRIIFLSAPLRK